MLHGLVPCSRSKQEREVLTGHILSGLLLPSVRLTAHDHAGAAACRDRWVETEQFFHVDRLAMRFWHSIGLCKQNCLYHPRVGIVPLSGQSKRA